ncbi:helix-turn-helix transcriptional regulator [Streptomyces capitiformicae]|uniref:HTH luxR-type domain-containing protein n=1 Tax=Streptomyces capitiformicae TaxID=2014920 RepID=A0A918ZDS4_9ACTN|nr:helix-turn-helix transcriptional regulator [Streptomyces capitiformicae]GHE46070.1 hypothetical protein GCM10017771_66750 [Streptomyces capitiformicae]
MSPAHPPHRVEELCEPGSELYARALREGRVRTEDAADTPCLIDFGLLHPNFEDTEWLEPTAPATALHRLLKNTAERIADERRREERLTATFEPLMGIGSAAAADTKAIRVLSSKERINEAISEAMADASQQLLAIQPHSAYHKRLEFNEAAHTAALERDQALLDRGCRIRTLYQHTLRHSPHVIARYELLDGDVEARTLNEVLDRLLIIDQTVAFVPANRDRTAAVEIRHPALVDYLVMVFDRLWHLAVPMYPQAVQQPSVNGITARQRAIAALLIEGHTDTAIADRLGMNVRTTRVHIAKLAATLGSESRAQLGYLIARSGILEQEGSAQ